MTGPEGEENVGLLGAGVSREPPRYGSHPAFTWAVSAGCLFMVIHFLSQHLWTPVVGWALLAGRGPEQRMEKVTCQPHRASSLANCAYE